MRDFCSEYESPEDSGTLDVVPGPLDVVPTELATVYGMLRGRDAAADLTAKLARLESLQVAKAIDDCAKAAELAALAHVHADLQGCWQPHSEALAMRLDNPTTRFGHPKAAGKWHKDRAATLRKPLSARLATCGKQAAKVRCNCGPSFLPVGCGLDKVCKACARRKYGRMRRKLSRAMRAWRVKANVNRPRGWGQELRWCMVTLTVRHTGDLSADRETIELGWQRLRAWIQDKFKRSFPYALVYEFTAGRDSLGHVHAHVAWLLPHVRWDKVSAAWRKGTDGKSSHLNFQGEKPEGDCAHYLAKYISKGVDGLNPEKAAAWMRNSYNRRNCRTSQGFADIAGKCPCNACGYFIVFRGIVEMPREHPAETLPILQGWQGPLNTA